MNAFLVNRRNRPLKMTDAGMAGGRRSCNMDQVLY
jgi:hypothetical protein